MKRTAALIMAAVMALSLAACSKKAETPQSTEYGSDAAGEAVSKIDEMKSTSVKDTTKLENLTEAQQKYVDSFGKTEKNKKIVAFIDTTSFSTFYYCKFESGKLTSAVCYRFAKLESLYKSLKNSVRQSGKVVMTDNTMCLSDDETEKYKGASYDEMLKSLEKYTLVK